MVMSLRLCRAEIFLNRMAGFQARIKSSNGLESAKSGHPRKRTLAPQAVFERQQKYGQFTPPLKRVLIAVTPRPRQAPGAFVAFTARYFSVRTDVAYRACSEPRPVACNGDPIALLIVTKRVRNRPSLATRLRRACK